jgi:preprotein translocase subunit SecG
MFSGMIFSSLLLGFFDLRLLLMQVLLFCVSLFLILLILVQRGKGGGLTGALGGMGGQSAFGSRAGDAFTKITVVTAIIWITLCMITIAYFNSPPAPKSAASLPAASSVNGDLSGPAENGNGGDSATTEEPSGVLPGESKAPGETSLDSGTGAVETEEGAESGSPADANASSGVGNTTDGQAPKSGDPSASSTPPMPELPKTEGDGN